MSAEDSTEVDGIETLSSVELAAARGELPEWSRVTPKRREHIARVAGLMEEWARELDLEDADVLRWAAAGWLHDCLRDADPATLVPGVPSAERDLPGSILHGPAAAERLKGSVHANIARAVHYHTLGHPSLDRLGRALYLADFLEPERKFEVEWRAELRSRMPRDLDAVLVDVIASRIRNLIDERKPIRPETAAFWSSVVPREKR